MLTKFLMIFIFSVFVDSTPAYPDSSQNLVEYYKRNQNEWDQRHKTYKNTENLQSKLIGQALKLLNEQKKNVMTTNFNKCLYQDNELRDKIICNIKDFIRENGEENNYSSHQDLTKSELVDIAQAMPIPSILADENHNTHQKNKKYSRSDLINEQMNNMKFITFNRCLHENYESDRKKCMKELVENTVRKGVVSNNHMNDYYENQDPFQPDRSEKKKTFSQDYLDINDLLRTNKNIDNDKTKKKIILKIVQPNKNKFARFDYDLTGVRKFNHDEDEMEIKNILRTDYDSSDSSSSDEKQAKRNDVKDESFDRDTEESSSDEEVKWKGKTKNKVDPIVYYMQGPSRMYGEDTRRRIPHFFPKRYHWDEEDIKDLKNYWFQGPQGKYSGQYKTPY